MLESKIKVLLSTIPIALLGAVMVLGVQSTALPALAQPAQETFFESDVRTANETQAGGGEAAAASTGPGAATQDGSQEGAVAGGGGGAAAAGASFVTTRTDIIFTKRCARKR